MRMKQDYIESGCLQRQGFLEMKRRLLATKRPKIVCPCFSVAMLRAILCWFITLKTLELLKGMPKQAYLWFFGLARKGGWTVTHFRADSLISFCPAVGRYCHKNTWHIKHCNWLTMVLAIPQTSQTCQRMFVLISYRKTPRLYFSRWIKEQSPHPRLIIWDAHSERWSKLWTLIKISPSHNFESSLLSRMGLTSLQSRNEVKESTMNAVWKKIWPGCVHNFAGFPRVCPVVTEFDNLAHKTGMEKVDEKDVNELLASHKQELTNEELIAIEQERAVEKRRQQQRRRTPLDSTISFA